MKDYSSISNAEPREWKDTFGPKVFSMLKQMWSTELKLMSDEQASDEIVNRMNKYTNTPSNLKNLIESDASEDEVVKAVTEKGGGGRIDPMNITDENELIKAVQNLAKKSKTFASKFMKAMEPYGKAAGQAIRK
ncbi:hypothetical protein Molly5_33 [Maribacter phage Molly_5]|uniref:Uncharacterized protein n=1 Tax=Maribacter phage Molly_1 TaxID=2745685 RepID=A0A8E4XZU3_9CAUD|nr:hypothetical protein M1M29_gp033 [Maribacter phage Molly_1]QQO97715.1 hypothetical protein Molly2_33 [Maribacter phage Molly_2]QQO97915.1 hypothetical protein Molly3_33 [Maribacter phage Molly_3]QQO98115.1 hypothetical protein Molly4_33 [Maribacter phage Molly_4]QQO98315.1 hypothetical protein Molly5_33 [Maribacter phage Molly_5]QQO97515.1 hypothetical protein Molly1_33 [Maribacter phage Molly_1]